MIINLTREKNKQNRAKKEYLFEVKTKLTKKTR